MSVYPDTLSKFDMVYARIDPSGQPNGGVTPNRSIYNIRASRRN